MNDGSELQVLEKEMYRDMVLENTECINVTLVVVVIVYCLYFVQHIQLHLIHRYIYIYIYIGRTILKTFLPTGQYIMLMLEEI